MLQIELCGKLFDYDNDMEYLCSKYTKSKNFTILMFAIINSDKFTEEEMETIVKEYTGKINDKNRKKWTVLHIVCANNYKYKISMVKLLFKYGADVNIKNNCGHTALHIASTYSDKENSVNVVKLLLQNGANVNMEDNSGYTPLLLVSRYFNMDNSQEIIKLLLQYGCVFDKEMYNELSNNIGGYEFIKLFEDINMVIRGDILIDIIKVSKGDDTNIFLDYVVGNKVKNDNMRINKRRLSKLYDHYNKFRNRYLDGSMSSKIKKYYYALEYEDKTKVYEEMKSNDGNILDFLCIREESEIWKISEYIK